MDGKKDNLILLPTAWHMRWLIALSRGICTATYLLGKGFGEFSQWTLLQCRLSALVQLPILYNRQEMKRSRKSGRLTKSGNNVEIAYRRLVE